MPLCDHQIEHAEHAITTPAHTFTGQHIAQFNSPFIFVIFCSLWLYNIYNGNNRFHRLDVSRGQKLTPAKHKIGTKIGQVRQAFMLRSTIQLTSCLYRSSLKRRKL